MRELKSDENGHYEFGDCIAMFIYHLYQGDPIYVEKKWIRPRPFLMSEIRKYWWGHIHSTFLFKIWYRILLHGYPFYKVETCRGWKYAFNVEALALFINEKVAKYSSFERKIIDPTVLAVKKSRAGLQRWLKFGKDSK